jgi:hypothetical protein
VTIGVPVSGVRHLDEIERKLVEGMPHRMAEDLSLESGRSDGVLLRDLLAGVTGGDGRAAAWDASGTKVALCQAMPMSEPGGQRGLGASK